MPRIPRYKSPATVESPNISPQMAAAPYAAAARAGEQVEQTGYYASRVFQAIAEKERRTEEALKLMKVKADINDHFDTNEESYRTRTDPENFDKDMQQEIEGTRDFLRPKDLSPEALEAYEAYFSNQAISYRNKVKVHKYNVMEQQGHIAIGRIVDQAYKDYANAEDDKHRELVLNKTELELRYIQNQKFLNPEWVENQIRGLQKGAEAYSVGLADVEADKAIEVDPIKASVDLRDRNFIPNLKPTQRQDKIEKAERAAKVKESEIEKKDKEAKQVAKENKEREIARLLGAGDYATAFTMAQSSDELTGDEIDKWSQAAIHRSKTTDVDVDRFEELQERAYIRNLKARGVDRKIIRDSIEISPRLTEKVRQQELEKLDKDWAKEIYRGSQRAYEYMKKEITSGSGLMAPLIKALPEDVRNRNYANSVLAFDEWVDGQIALDKPPSPTDMVKKSEELASIYRPKISVNSPIIQQKTTNLVTGLGELGDIVTKQKKTIEPGVVDVEKIGTKYKSIEEVKEAYAKKELTWDEAAEILRKQFNVK